MKRKLLNGLLLATALVGVGTMQSCKDYESDFQNEWKQQNYTLEEEMALLKNRVGDLERVQAQCQANCNAKIQQILDMIGVWDPAQRGTIAQNITNLLNRTGGITEDEARKLIYNILIDCGWGADSDGKPAYIDLPALQDKVLELAREVAVMNVKIQDLQEAIDYLNGLDIANRLDQIEEWIRNHRDGAAGLTEDQVRAIAQQEAQKALDVFKQELAADLASLRTYIDQQDALLQGQIDNLTGTINRLETRLSATEINALNALNQANDNKAAITVLQGLVTGLQAAIDAANARMDSMAGDIAANKTAITAMQTKLTELGTKLDNLQQQYDELDTKFEELSGKVDTLDTQVGENTSNIAEILEALKTLASQASLDALAKRVDANESAIKTLQGDVMTLFGIYNRLNKLVTGIIVQSVYNPLFGNFSLPLGIKSNMLVNYYGKYDGVQPLVFPSETATTNRPMLTAEEVANLGSLISPITINNGDIMMDGNMGKVYMTINPSNVALDGVQLTMESSNGTASRVELQNVKRSYENLTFGYTRAAGNGFYEADAVMPLTAGAVHATQLQLEDGLKGAVKDVLKDRSRANIFNLMKAVFGQLNQDLPAYALKTTWTANDGQGDKEYAVLSNYEIAAVTFRPLSYNTYAGQSIDHRFNHHGPLKDAKDYLNDLINKDRFHFTLHANVNINPNVDVQFKLDEIDNITLEYNGDLTVTSQGLNFDIYDDAGNVIGHGKTEPFTLPVTDTELNSFLQQLANQVKEQINAQLPIWDKQMEDEFKNAMAQLSGQVDAEVNKALKDLEANINDQIDKIINDMIDDIAGKTQGLIDKLNKFLDKYNEVVDKVNDFLADPNHYLQVAMLYTTGGGNLHRLSTDRNDPTMLNPAGGNGVEVIATSYTAEIAAPAYKKFVAISAAWDKNGRALSPAEIQALNTGHLAKVMSGRAKRFGIPTGKMKSGYTYQIVYTGVDYHGYTSAERYYVRMK